MPYISKTELKEIREIMQYFHGGLTDVEAATGEKQEYTDKMEVIINNINNKLDASNR